MATRADISALVEAPKKELVRMDVLQALGSRVARLQSDEQYSVRLFQKARTSVAHIKTLTQPRSSFLQLDPGAIQPGTGSGFLWDTSGHVVTNFHVVQSAARVKVTLSDQRTHDATLVGVDPNNDVAVLKLPADAAAADGGNEPISVGTSHDLMVGQKVFAIGNPFGLDQTLTAGIVSSVNRQIQGVARRVIRDVIQTDAAINPGNSGGPLLDSSGRLIGINTMIYSPGGGGNVGIGFAVPINTVRRSVAQIIAYGRVRRGRIGLRLLGDEPSMHLRHALGLPPGVIVHAVEPASGAEQAGIRGFSVNAAGEPVPGDLIIAVGGEKVQSSEDIAAIVEQFSVGDQVPVTLLRGRAEVVINVPLVELPDAVG
eukprot:jgi/Ulvmu1/797/UM010_0171.1